PPPPRPRWIAPLVSLVALAPWLWWPAATTTAPNTLNAPSTPLAAAPQALAGQPQDATAAPKATRSNADPEAATRPDTPSPAANDAANDALGGEAPIPDHLKRAGIGAAAAVGAVTSAGRAEASLSGALEGEGGALEGAAHLSRLDAVADPARPYPARYHEAISSYFAITLTPAHQGVALEP
ncbi:hypothetical protein KJ940_05995, partial [Myxococcota bacterium]|nr:hypothetical protein [Myxococcota bacterium]